MKAINPRLKRAAQWLLPKRAFATAQSIRSRNHQRELLREWGVERATREMIDEFGLEVLDGPFRGMRYPEASLASHDGVPILFASYEMELHPVIEQMARSPYERIINIGAGEGYYSVGLALRIAAPVFAFDCEPRERKFLREMARLNGVAGRVHARPWCSPRTLRNLAAGSRCLLVVDCEGYEAELFEAEAVSALSFSDLIVEIHENGACADVRGLLLRRFSASHAARTFTFDPSNSPDRIPAKWRAFAREFRPAGQQWLALSARESSPERPRRPV